MGEEDICNKEKQQLRKLDVITYIVILGLFLPFIPIAIENRCIVENKQTLISFTIDDGYRSWYEIIDLISEKYGLPITGFLTNNLISLTWDEVKYLRDTGRWEFGWHTIDHPYLIRLNYTEMERQISDWSVFEKYGLPSPETFAYPYGGYNYKAKEIASKYFLASRTTYEDVNTVCSIKDNPIGAFLSFGIPVPNRYLQLMVGVVDLLGRFVPSVADSIIPFMVPIVTFVFIGAISFLVSRIILLRRKKDEN